MTISSVNTDPAASDMAVPRFIASDIQQSEPQANGLMPTQTPMSGIKPPAIKQLATGAVIPSENQVSNLTGIVGNAAKTMISNVPAPNPPSSAKKLGQELMEAGTDLVSNHPFLVYSALGGIAAGAGKVAYDKHTHPWFKENKESVIENRKEPVLEVEKPTIEKPEAVLKEKEKTLSELADKMPVNNEQLKTGQDILNLTNQPNPSVSNNPVGSGDNANPLKDPGADSGKSQLETTKESTNQEQPKVEPATGEKKLGTEPRQNLTHEQWTEHLKNPEIRKNAQDLFKTNNPEQELSIALNRGGLSEKEEQAILTGEGKDMYSNKSSETNTTKESGNLTNPAENPTQGGVEQVKKEVAPEKEVKGAAKPRRKPNEIPEGQVFKEGFGGADNWLQSAVGHDIRKFVRDTFNEGKPYGSGEDAMKKAYEHVNKYEQWLKENIPEQTYSRVERKAAGLPPPEIHGPLGTKAKIAGVAGLLMAASQASNAKELRNNLGEALLPLSATPTPVESGKLTSKQLEQYKEYGKLGSPYRQAFLQQTGGK